MEVNSEIIELDNEGYLIEPSQWSREVAIETGLDKMPQMGVMAEQHHKFDVKALVNVIKQTTVKEAFMQIKSIVRGG